ncbi:MAG: ABC transporter substrate-binding protein [Rhodospirillum sp.]|nr:ABC transporter substrate-binding protein [Rhodospirillum sp.]MCF8487826.1 ABC transporter substrate-binding protein [Rhodospirillum sp.]MCF8502891.1 ABC transporter substrate-binding protein [Rhodospirillum sp.]
MRLTRVLAFASALVASAVGLSPPTQAEEVHMTVLLDWFVNPDHGPLIVAKELGYFKEMGLDVDLVAPADPNDPPKLIAAGKAEVAIGYQPQLHVQVAEGLPLVRFGTLVATPLNALVALKDGPIKSLKDLKGRKVGYSVGGFEDALLGAMLASEGLRLDDVELVNVNFSLSPAVISGQVDAVIGAFRNFELNQMEIEGHPGVAFYPEEHGVPVYDELIFITATDLRDDPRLAAFLAAVERGTHYIVNHPEESWDIFRGHSPDVDDELNKRAWFATIPRFDMTPAALDSGRYARFAGFLKDRGLIKEIVPVATYATAVGGE